jgi:hypothetical protein
MDIAVNFSKICEKFVSVAMMAALLLLVGWLTELVVTMIMIMTLLYVVVCTNVKLEAALKGKKATRFHCTCLLSLLLVQQKQKNGNWFHTNETRD